MKTTDIKKSLIKLFDSKATFERPADPTNGDLSTSIAMKMASELKKSPMDIAKKLVSEITLPVEIGRVEIAAPGFINFYYSNDYLLSALDDPKVLLNTATRKGKVVVDYSGPNIAKPLGVHHLLSTIIGQATVNILRSVGYEVVGVNYIGDWGTQFGKLIYAYNKWGDRKKIEKHPIDELLKLYVKFHEEAPKEPSIEDGGREEFKKLEDGDPTNRELWEWIVKLSLDETQKVYDILGGINFTEVRGEAATEPDLQTVLNEGKSLEIIVKGDKGAYIIDLEKEGMIPFLVEKQDEATLYSTRDIATIRYRIQKYTPDKIVYVVDVAQMLHFQQLFASVKKFPWYKETDLIHLKFGRMSFKDKSMSTRKGNILKLEDVLKEAIKRAKTVIAEKNPDLKNAEDVARIVGVGAVKYSVLAQAPETNIVFDWEKILSLDGNSAPYLQYSYARAANILGNLNVNLQGDTGGYMLNEDEKGMIRLFLVFAEAVNEAADKLKPNLLVNYLYALASAFNHFYGKCPVINADNPDARNVRIRIVKTFSEIMKKGLDLLGGIESPEKM